MAAILLSNHPRTKDLEVYISGETYSKLDEEIRDHVQECETCLQKAADLLRKRLEAEGSPGYHRQTGERFQPESRH